MPAMRWLLFLLLSAAWLSAADGAMKGADAMDDEERASKRMEEFMADAAEYRIARSNHVPVPGEDEAVSAGLRKAEEMRLHGGRSWYQLWMFSAVTRARWVAEGVYKDHPFAPTSGRLLHYALDRCAENHEASGTLDTLMDLWFRMPDYPDMQRAFETALAVANRLQDFDTKVDLEQTDPGKVVAISGTHGGYGVEDLFRFISVHGDRDTVAPRAALGLARALLLTGDRGDRSRARHAYEDFLDRFPDSELAFDVVLEQALTWMVTYKGSDYDIGALLAARNLIDLAELEVGGDPARAAKIAAYRRRVTSWLQDRDLSVALWYSARTRPWWLSWLRKPTELKNPDSGARFYAQQVIARDRAAPESSRAQALLESLPAAPDLLGAPR